MDYITIYPNEIKKVFYEREGRRVIIQTYRGDFEIKRSCFSKFMKMMKIDKSMLKLPEPKVEAIIMSRLRKRKFGLKLAVENGRVVGVFSSLFVPVAHGVIIKAVNDILKEMELNSTRRYWMNAEFYGRWILDDFTIIDDLPNVRPMLWVYNKNDGSTAMRIGVGYHDYTCDNGAIGWREAVKLRIIHKMREDLVESHIKNAIRIVLNKFERLKELISDAYWKTVDYHDISKFLRKIRLPAYIESVIRLRIGMSSPKTLWNLSSAISYAANLDSVPPSRKLELMKLAFDVLDSSFFEKKVSEYGEKDDDNDFI